MLRLAVLNHLLAEKADLRRSLALYAGQIGCIAVPPWQLVFAVLPDGLLASSDAGPNATISVSPWLLPRLALGDVQAEREVRIDGDTHFAAAIAQVLRSLNWDAERDLSRLTGDVVAHRIADSARRWIGDPKLVVQNLAAASTEYLQEEADVLVARASVDAFVSAVDVLRDDAARLEKRLAQLERLS